MLCIQVGHANETNWEYMRRQIDKLEYTKNRFVVEIQRKFMEIR